MDSAFDIVVLGREPAAGVAAIACRRDAERVALVAPPADATCDALDWLGPAGGALLEQLGIRPQKLRKAAPFSGLTLWAWDLDRRIRIEGPPLAGWIVPTSALESTLIEHARRQGVQVCPGPLEACRVDEDAVRVTLADGRTLTAAVAIVCDPTGVETHPPNQPPPPARVVCCAAEVASRARSGSVHVALGRGGRLAMVLCGREATRLVAYAPRDDAGITEAFESLVHAARGAGLIDRTADVPVPSPRPLCSGAALEAESHARKRMLLAGTAGGFRSAFSHERLYPQMRSGWLAAETAVRAVRAPVLQDVLTGFGPAWRSELADYLRMPNADLSLLLPLVFENEQMATRVARALLLGETL